jgi:AraC family transcriptional regulator
LGSLLISSPAEKHQFTDEFYYHLAEQLVLDHIPIYKQLQSIGAVKSQTRKDLLRKLQVGKAFLETSFASELPIAAVARECGLSEYHFFRLFKSTYGISPHQYLIQCRIQHARKLVQHTGISMSEIAYLCGFSDVFSFSKSFKKHTGHAPTQFFRKG